MLSWLFGGSAKRKTSKKTKRKRAIKTLYSALKKAKRAGFRGYVKKKKTTRYSRGYRPYSRSTRRSFARWA